MNAPKKPIVQTSALESGLGRFLRILFVPRMGVWLWISIVLLIAIWWFAEHMLKVILYKGVLLTLAAFLCDKIARGIERSGKRPHELLQEADAIRARDWERSWQLEQLAQNVYHRRAIIIAAGMIAAALGS